MFPIVVCILSLLIHLNIITGDAVQKYTLKNNLTVLVREKHDIPQVAIQIWYEVGSKDELVGEKGIAHLLEHTVFKGTNKLSETDHGSVVHKLSGSCNGITSYDCTHYICNLHNTWLYNI